MKYYIAKLTALHLFFILICNSILGQNPLIETTNHNLADEINRIAFEHQKDTGHFEKKKGTLFSPLQKYHLVELHSNGTSLKYKADSGTAATAIADGKIVKIVKQKISALNTIVIQNGPYFHMYSNVHSSAILNQKILAGDKLGTTSSAELSISLWKGMSPLNAMSWIRLGSGIISDEEISRLKTNPKSTFRTLHPRLSFDSIQTTYYPEGQLKSIQGKTRITQCCDIYEIQGFTLKFYSSGKLKNLSFHRGGGLLGRSLHFDKNERLIKEESYTQTSFADTCYCWNKADDLIYPEPVTTFESLKDGLWKKYDYSNNLILIQSWRKGHLIESRKIVLKE